MKNLLFLPIVFCWYSYGLGQTAKDFYEAGKEKHRQQDYSGAISDYTKAIDIDNNFSAAYESRASCRGLLADTIGAIADVSMAIKVENSDSAKAELYIHRGFWKEKSGDYLGAIYDYGQAIKHYPTGNGYFSRGKAKQILGDNRGAILDLDEDIKISPQSFSAYHFRGAAKLALGDNKGAETDFTVSLETNFVYYNSAGNFPPIRWSDYYAAESYRQRALARTRLGNTDGALSDYDKAIELDSQNWAAFFSRGLLKFVSWEDSYGALSDFSKSIEINGGIPDAFYFRGMVRNILRDFNGALSDLSVAIRLDSKNASYYIERGEVKVELFDYRGAIVDYSSAIGLDPNSPLSHYGRGAAKFFLSDFRGALSDINTALAFKKEFSEKSKAYFVRGVCKINLGQLDGGCLDLSKSGELGFGDAYNLIREHCN